jgi:hypothetical protein
MGLKITPKNIFLIPSDCSAPTPPDAAITEPIKAPNKACEQLIGSPCLVHKATHIGAVITAAKKVTPERNRGSAILCPTVRATSEQNSAPTKFNTTPKMIAFPKDNTRVEITVAMAFAASFNPLEILKMRAKKIVSDRVRYPSGNIHIFLKKGK